jgi:hypothetical protein
MPGRPGAPLGPVTPGVPGAPLAPCAPVISLISISLRYPVGQVVLETRVTRRPSLAALTVDEIFRHTTCAVALDVATPEKTNARM